jgi:uncharacterized membrane protein
VFVWTCRPANIVIWLATLGRIEQLERSMDDQAKTSLTLLQSNTQLITQMPQLQTAANAMLGRPEQMNAELNAIREAVAPGVPDPAKGTDTDGAAQELLDSYLTASISRQAQASYLMTGGDPAGRVSAS